MNWQNTLIHLRYDLRYDSIEFSDIKGAHSAPNILVEEKQNYSDKL